MPIVPEGRFIPVNMDRCQDIMGGGAVRACYTRAELNSDNKESTSLMTGIEKGNVEYLTELIDAGVNLNISNSVQDDSFEDNKCDYQLSIIFLN